jgi:Ca2+/Na+ antiporter
MADPDSILYSIGAFTCALFVLEFGADKFIDHTAILANQTGIPEGLIALLTAGAEWEELAVVILSIARGHESLALGNVVGSAIANILGAFSLGLLFSSTARGGLEVDASSVRYTVLQLGVTVVAAIALGLQKHLHLQVVGIGLIVLFIVYIGSILWAIRKGLVHGPELSDSDSDSNSDDGNGGEGPSTSRGPAQIARAYGTFVGEDQVSRQDSHSSDSLESLSYPSMSHTTDRSLAYHLFHLFLGFISLLVSAYVLTHAATSLVAQLHLSDAVFGMIVLSIATTLPEKFIAVVSGLRGQTGIMVANTAGSNIFLLTLCLGIVWVSPGGHDKPEQRAAISATELVTLLASSALMCIAVFTRGRVAKGIGLGMLVAYVAFFVLEVTLMKDV